MKVVNAMKIYIFFVYFLFLPFFVFSQTEGHIVREIDFEGRQVKEVFPFDQRFKIKSFDTQFDELYFKYYIKDLPKIKDSISKLTTLIENNPNDKINYERIKKRLEREERKFYFLGENLGEIEINKIDPNAKKAIISSSIGPLHPNVEYVFEFQGRKYIRLTTEQELELRVKTADIITKYYKDNGVKNQAFSTIRKEVHNLLMALVGSKNIYDKDNNKIELDTSRLYATHLNDPIDSLGIYYYTIETAESNITQKSDTIIKKVKRSESLFAKIEDLANGKLDNEITTETQDKINEPLEDSDISFKQIATIIKLYGKDDFINKVLKQSYKITKTGLALFDSQNEGIAVDNNSINLLFHFFKFLNEKRDINNNLLFETDINDLNELTKDFGSIKSEVKNIYDFKEKIKKLSEEIPNVLRNAYILEDIKINESVFIDIVSSKNPYVGVDLGVVYAFSPQVLFSYQGLNIYFRPINREALFEDFKRGDRFWKRFSVYIGIAQPLTDKPKKFESLFGDNNLLTGVGWRFNRAMRLNIGGLVYKERNENPLINNEKIKLSPTISVSFDIDLVAAFGSVGKILNLKE